jgi:hypothetical protein
LALGCGDGSPPLVALLLAHRVTAMAASMTHWVWHHPRGVLPICWPMVTGCQHMGQVDVLRAFMTLLALMAGPRAGRRRQSDQKLGD